MTTTPSPFAVLAPHAGEHPDYDALRAILQESVPFNVHVGLRIVEVGPTRGSVEVPYRPELTNAVATLHAGVLFLAADMAGSAAFLGAAAGRLGSLRTFFLKDCRISFLRPGTGAVTVTAVMDEQMLPALLTRHGRVTCDAKAYVHDGTGALIGKASLEFFAELADDSLADDNLAGPGAAP